MTKEELKDVLDRIAIDAYWYGEEIGDYNMKHVSTNNEFKKAFDLLWKAIERGDVRDG